MDISNLPPELLTPIVIGLVFAALASIAGFALMALSIWEKLHEERKKTDGQLFDLIRQQNKDLRDQIEASQVGTNRELNSVAKEVGRLIGVVEALQKGGN